MRVEMRSTAQQDTSFILEQNSAVRASELEAQDTVYLQNTNIFGGMVQPGCMDSIDDASDTISVDDLLNEIQEDSKYVDFAGMPSFQTTSMA